VRLAETGADGFVPISTLGRDHFAYDEARHALTAKQSGDSYRLADPIEVRLIEVAPVAGALRFEPAQGPSRPGSKRVSTPRARSKRRG
jgi:ribonuclease R